MSADTRRSATTPRRRHRKRVSRGIPSPGPIIPGLGYCPQGHYALLGNHCGACGSDLAPEEGK